MREREGARRRGEGGAPFSRALTLRDVRVMRMRWVLTAGAAESNSLSALATLDMAGWAFGGGGGRGGANLSTRQWGRVRMIRRCGKDKAGTTHAEHWHVQEVTRGEEKDKRGARRRARSLAFGRRRYSLATCASLPPAGSAVDALLTCTSLILSIQTRARGPAVQRRVAPLPPVLSPPPSPHARHRALHGLSVPQHLKAPSAPPLNAAARLVAPGPVARSPSAGAALARAQPTLHLRAWPSRNTTGVGAHTCARSSLEPWAQACPRTPRRTRTMEARVLFLCHALSLLCFLVAVCSARTTVLQVRTDAQHLPMVIGS